MTLAFIGAGSYVFGPSVLRQLLDSSLDEVELRLIDPNLASIEPLSEAFRSEACRRGKRIHVATYAELNGSLNGADFVIHSAAPAMRSLFARNREILSEIYPDHILTEFGGVHGIAYSVSQVRFLRAIAEEMLHACPKAWMLTSANPLPRVCTAAHRLGIQSAGFCSVAIVANKLILELLDGLDEDYPYEFARQKYDIATAGTNHLACIVRAQERTSGVDLLPALRRFGDEESTSKSLRWLARTGFLLSAGDSHITDFLPIEGIESQPASTSHGDDSDRRRRLEMIRYVAEGARPFSILDEHPAWEHPISVIEALLGGPNYSAPSMNLPNRGQIPELPFGAIVETPVRVDSEGIWPETLDLPSSVVAHNQRAIEITEAIVDYVLEGSGDSLSRALELDPTIVDKTRGLKALEQCLNTL